MEAISFALAFVAGVVSIFSPCVLPLLPVVLGAAASAHRTGPLALAAGIALSFLTLGLLVAAFGFSLGLDGDMLRAVAAALVVGAGLVLILPPLQLRLALAAAPLGNWLEQSLGSRVRSGVAGQFGVGLLLGAVWTPCVGPTLGAAAVLASQGRDLARVALTMMSFASGTALALLLFGLASRQSLTRWRGKLSAGGATGKLLLGSALVGTGTLVLAGYDKVVEARLLDLMPDWLVALTTKL